MPVDPQIQALLTMLESSGQPPLAQGTVAEARAVFAGMGSLLPGDPVPVTSTEDVAVPGPAGDLPARVYRPEASGPVPTIVYFHGGGWVIGDIDTHDDCCRTLCREVGAVVLSVGYRLAPEARFPAAVDDCVAATRWAGEHVGELGGDEARVVVAGDSAGGNLAAVVAQILRDEHGPTLAAQLLLYPAVDAANDYPSRTENGAGYFLTAENMAWFVDHYAPDPPTHADPRLSPALAEDLTGLPPAVVATAQYDPLRDEGDAYAAALRAAGVPVVARCFDGLIHGFFHFGPLSPAAAAAVRTVCADLRTVLAPAPATSSG